METMEQTICKNPIIAAVRSGFELNRALSSDAQVIFLLKSSLFELKSAVTAIKEQNKRCAVHFDFIDGLGASNAAVDWLFDTVEVDAIISTRNQPIRYAVKKGFCGIQRFFLIDSLSVDTAASQMEKTNPTMVEILPGIMHGVTQSFCHRTKTNVIAGGMIKIEKQVKGALASGACAISTSEQTLWSLNQSSKK